MKRIIQNNLLLILLTGMIFTFFPGNTIAQSGYTLQQAIDYALKNHADVLNGKLETDIAAAKVNEYLGIGMPQINGSAEIIRFLDIPTQFVPAEFFGGDAGTYAPVKFGQNYSASAGLTGSQLLFDGSYLVGLKATKLYAELSKKELTVTKTDLAAKVSKAYYMVLVARERAGQLNADLDRMAKLKADTKAMLDNGFVEKIDYDRVELSYNLIANARDYAQRMAANSMDLLKFQMGVPLKSEIELTETIGDVTIDAALFTKDSVDPMQRPEYDVIKTRHTLTGLDLKRYRMARYPSLVLFGGYSVSASRNDFTFFDSGYRWFPGSQVGVKLTMPIMNGFMKTAQIRQARYRDQQVANAIVRLEEAFQLEYRSSVTQAQTALDRLNTQKRNRELARDIARVSKIKYEQGVGSNLEVIEAETALREAEANYYTSLLETLIAKIDLEKATGAIRVQ